MTDAKKPSALFPALAVRLAAAWLLAGALFKLLRGTPADLPPSTRVLDDLVLTYQIYIAIELAVGTFAMLRPRHAWWLIAGAFAVFELVLAQQIAAGAESCGCFGSKIKIEPWQMMAIDTTLLGLMLASRPWRRLGGGKGAPWWLVAVVAAAGAAAPFVYLHEATETGPTPANGAGQTSGGPVGRGFVSLDIEDWVGKSIYDTPLAKWIDGGVDALPPDGLWVLWRWTCDHCAKHLEHLTYNPPETPFVTLVRLKEPQDTEANRVVFTMPAGDNVIEATCPDTVDYILTTPGELWLEGGVIVRAVEGADAGDE